jgi:hypothetical protein
MTLIPIHGRGGVVAHAIVDDEDAAMVSDKRWHINQRGAAWCRSVKTNMKVVKMHRLITGAANGLDVDHINHNPLDNRRRNLRVCTHAENMMNVRPYSQSCGVRPVGKSWRAFLSHGGRQIHVGYFKTKDDAIAARSLKAIELRGEFAAKEYTNV